MLRGGHVAMLLRRVFIKFDVRPLFVQPSLLRTMSLSLCYLHKRHHHHHLHPHFGSSAVCLKSWFQRWVSTTASGTHKCSSEKTHSKIEIYRFDNHNNKTALNATLNTCYMSRAKTSSAQILVLFSSERVFRRPVTTNNSVTERGACIVQPTHFPKLC